MGYPRRVTPKDCETVFLHLEKHCLYLRKVKQNPYLQMDCRKVSPHWDCPMVWLKVSDLEFPLKVNPMPFPHWENQTVFPEMESRMVCLDLDCQRRFPPRESLMGFLGLGSRLDFH